MWSSPLPIHTAGPSVEIHLLGRIDFRRALALQQRLVDEVADRADGQIKLLFCEHPPLVTIGRSGSPAEVRYDAEPIRQRRVEVCWVKRGGGCLVHVPGQLAVYPIVPIGWYGLTPGRFLSLIGSAVEKTLDELRIPLTTHSGSVMFSGRTGGLVAAGLAIRRWVTYHGLYINVCPLPGWFRLVEPDATGHTLDGSLVAERRGRISMATVRARLVQYLTEALDCPRYHMHTGHPWLRDMTE